jgi:SGNH hydrolase-like domain, acetyltransferase AlgX
MSRRAAPVRPRPPRRVAVLLAVAVSLLGVNLALLDSAAGDDGRRQRDGEVPTGFFLGIDGLVHAYANLAVGGKDGYLFLGPDFDSACGNGAEFKRGLKGLARLAKVIERSGRRVVFTVAPNKSSVETHEVYALPHGPCDSVGIKRQIKDLDKFHAKNFIPLRKQLVDTRYPYWKTDAHWNTVGATVFAQDVARALSPQLIQQQKYQKTQRTLLGELERFLNGSTPETAPAKLPHNGVKVRPAPGSPTYDPTYASLQPINAWVSSPARKTWKGDTVLIGDSFMYTALEPMRNLFHKGRSLWVGIAPVDTMLQAIKGSDTVVLEVVQRFVSTSILATPEFRHQVHDILKKH